MLKKILYYPMNIVLIFKKQKSYSTFFFKVELHQTNHQMINLHPIIRSYTSTITWRKTKPSQAFKILTSKPMQKQLTPKKNKKIVDIMKINFPTENRKFWISIYVFQGLLVILCTSTCIHCLYQKMKRRNFVRK